MVNTLVLIIISQFVYYNIKYVYFDVTIGHVINIISLQCISQEQNYALCDTFEVPYMIIIVWCRMIIYCIVPNVWLIVDNECVKYWDIWFKKLFHNYYVTYLLLYILQLYIKLWYLYICLYFSRSQKCNIKCLVWRKYIIFWCNVLSRNVIKCLSHFPYHKIIEKCPMWRKYVYFDVMFCH